MSYDSWITEIYNIYDGRFKFLEALDHIDWLESIIKKNLGSDFLYDENDEYKWTPKDEYMGYKRGETTSGGER